MTDVTLDVSSADYAPSEQWWKSAVVYQIYPRSFADSNGDGIGDLRGIIDRLDHLENLGVDVIWLSPIYDSPHDDHGYDIRDYQVIDPIFGTLEDFDALIADVHGRGMKLVMDLVVNHTSDEHPWFVESASDESNPKRDWYWWRKPRPGYVGGEPGAEPTNWSSFFSGSTWEYDKASDEYYLHLFSRKQPDLNWENMEVRAAIYQMMRWWLDRGVDGFRMDVINLISKDPDLPDGEMTEGAFFGNGFPHYSYGPRIHEFLAEMHEQVFADRIGQFVTIGEMPGVTIEQARLFTDANRRELDMVFQFEHVDLDHGPGGKWQARQLDVRNLKASFQRWQNGLSQVGWNSLYWNNHDQPRVASRFGDDQNYWLESTKLLATVLHLQQGTPFIYQGEEIGMTNMPFSDISEIRDIESLNHYAEATRTHGLEVNDVLLGLRRSSRDNARTPMQWDSSTHGGFTRGDPWIGANPNFRTINAETQQGTPGSVYEFYRSLIRLRHVEPVVAHGDFCMVAPKHRALFAFTRSLETTRLLVLANFSDQIIEINKLEDFNPSIWDQAEVILANYGSIKTPNIDALRPWEVRVFKLSTPQQSDV